MHLRFLRSSVEGEDGHGNQTEVYVGKKLDESNDQNLCLAFAYFRDYQTIAWHACNAHVS